MFPLNSNMYEGKGLKFNQAHQFSMYLDVGGVDAQLLKLIKILYHDLNINVPFSQAKSLIKHGKFFLPYFKVWIRKFHQNCRVLTNVLCMVLKFLISDIVYRSNTRVIYSIIQTH